MKLPEKCHYVGLGVLILAGCAAQDGEVPRSSSPSRASNQVSSDPIAAGLDFAPRAYRGAGRIRCSMDGGERVTYCPYVVAREDNGNAVVTVKNSDGTERTIRFSGGRGTGAEGGDGPFSATREGGLNIIRIGEEVYAIPDAVIHGG